MHRNIPELLFLLFSNIKMLVFGLSFILFFTDINNLMYQLKTEDVYEDFSKDKEIFDFSNYSAKSKYYDDSNKLVVGKAEDVFFSFFLFFFLADDSSECKKKSM